MMIENGGSGLREVFIFAFNGTRLSYGRWKTLTEVSISDATAHGNRLLSLAFLVYSGAERNARAACGKRMTIVRKNR